jgi:SAM-dependent methyltransferase
MQAKLYDNPEYYEIAFSFRDIAAEVAVFEECFRRFSRIPVTSVLELACGNSPHMEELARRGYRYTGLDLSQAMIDYAGKKAATSGIEARLLQGDMVDFRLDAPVDFAYVLLGSLFATSTDALMTHFGSVARALRPGGLYFLDWCIEYELPLASDEGSSWELERDGIQVRTTVKWEPISRVEQTFVEVITLVVNDHGEEKTVVGRETRRAIYPQEFLCFVRNSADFEFVGWWSNWDLSQPLERAQKIDRPITLLRRTGWK